MAESYLWHGGWWMMLVNILLWVAVFGLVIYLIGRQPSDSGGG